DLPAQPIELSDVIGTDHVRRQIRQKPRPRLLLGHVSDAQAEHARGLVRASPRDEEVEVATQPLVSQVAELLPLPPLLQTSRKSGDDVNDHGVDLELAAADQVSPGALELLEVVGVDVPTIAE